MGVVRVRPGDAEAVGIVALPCGEDTVNREGVRLIWGVVVKLSAGLSAVAGLSWEEGVLEGSSLMEVMEDCGPRDCCHCRRRWESMRRVGRGAWIACAFVGEVGGWSPEMICDGGE